MGSASTAPVPSRRTAAAEQRRSVRRFRRFWFLPEGRRLTDEVWSQRHRGLTLLLWAHVPGLYLFAVLRGWAPLGGALQCVPLVVPALIAMVRSLSRNIRSASTSIGLVIAASILVHLANGSIEAHFDFFVILAFLTLYQAWLPLILSLVYVVGEHGIIGAIDPRAVYNDPADLAHPWEYAAIHGGFILAASFANVLSWRLTEQEALTDGLTGLPNRIFFLDSLSRILEGRGVTSTAVLFLDLDNFKDANDVFGHNVGDELLRALAHRLQRWLRAGDLLARLGGDEFAIVLCDVADRATARLAAERILTAFVDPFRVAGITLESSASVGLAFADGDTESAADLLRNADLAMYDAKRNGGGRVAEYQPILHAVALRRAELEVEMRQALEEGQFVLYYQPIFEISSKRMVGTEALVRWLHPTRGLVPPGDFIAAAEQSGLIVPLGKWVLRTACRQTAQWQADRPDDAPMWVSVNLSPRQLLDRALVTTVAEALSDADLDASSLCLEVTEGSVITDFEATMPTLRVLRSLGVSLALDDFGTGYSSLSYLKQLPVNSVKIDRSFVRDLGRDTPNAKIVQAIVDLAHALGITVTAEGAETEAQLELLRSTGSDHVQGFLLGRPVPAEVMSEQLRRRPARIDLGR